MLWILLLIALLATAIMSFRYYSLLHALKQIEQELGLIEENIDQNQGLQLPLPNRHLATLLVAFNRVLASLQAERLQYKKRERAFQKQIENVSHDLRTPLTVILGYLKLIKQENKQGKLNEGQLLNSLDIIDKKAENMKKLVSQFYDFSRLTADDYLLNLERLDLTRSLRESLLGHYQLFSKANLQVTARLEEAAFVMGDKTALERIFSNLLQNASRYAKSFLDIAIEKEEKKVIVHFTNDSDQVQAEDIPQLFNRFYIQDQARQQGGTGLGLTVAQKLAQEMNGSLSVDLLEDKKDCLTLRFSLTLTALD